MAVGVEGGRLLKGFRVARRSASGSRRIDLPLQPYSEPLSLPEKFRMDFI